MLSLTLVGRMYCHLCHDMEQAVRPIADEFGVKLHLVDADSDPAMEARFGERVPVLLGGDLELCHYFIDVAKVRDYLSKIS